MDGRALTEGYFSALPEIEETLQLPLLGRLDAEPRFYQLQEVLASLAPDPRFAERLYRLLGQHPPRVWVAGLGDAGEEIPVAVGLAEQAAGEREAAVLLARLQDSMPETARRPVLRPVIAPGLDSRLSLLFPSGCAAMPSGIQGVFRAFEVSAADGEPIAPDSLIVAVSTHDEDRWPPRGSVDAVVLVVPFRDQPRDRIVAQATALREAGYEIAGFVAFGPPGTAAGHWDGNEDEDDATEGERASLGAPEPASGSERPSASREPLRGGAPIAERLDAQEGEEVGERDGASSAPEPEGPSAADARIPVSRSWSDTYGPRKRGFFARRRGGGSGGSRPWIPILLILALLVVAVVVARQMGWELPLVGKSQHADEAALSPRPVQAAQPVLPPAAGTTADETEPPAPQDPSVESGAADPAEASSDAITAGAAAEMPPAEVSGAFVAARPVSSETDGAAPEGASADAGEVSRDASPDAGTVLDAPPESPAPAPEVAPPAIPMRDMVASYEGPFAVLCGSFRREANAANLAQRLRDQKLAARVQSVRIPDRGIWHRVVIGGGADRAAARRLAQRAVDSGWVTEAQVVAQNGWGHGVPHPIRRDGTASQ